MKLILGGGGGGGGGGQAQHCMCWHVLGIIKVMHEVIKLNYRHNSVYPSYIKLSKTA